MKHHFDHETFLANLSWFSRNMACFFAVALLTALVGCDASHTSNDSATTLHPSPTNIISSTAAILDLAGKPVDPFRADDVNARVFIFISTDCPISNRYAPEIRRLHAKFALQKIAFWLVHADPTDSVAAIRKHAEDYQLTCDLLRDPGHALVQRCRTRVTPEAAVFTRDGRLAYHGRIDDRYVELGQARPEARTHDLEVTLEAILAGKPVPTNETRAIGCSIPSLK